MADNNKKGNKKDLQNELDDLLKNFSADDNSVDDELSDIDEIDCPIDFEELEETYRKQAEEMTLAFLKTFVDNDLIEDDQYTKVKQQMDQMNLEDFLYQRKIYKLMINQLTKEVMTGQVKARNIEVLGQLQSKLEALNKTIANYALFLEETYKKFNHEARQRLEELPPGKRENSNIEDEEAEVKKIDHDGEHYVSAGTKSIIQELPDTEISYEESDELTDPTKKTDLMTKRGIEIKEDDDTDSDVDIDEMI